MDSDQSSRFPPSELLPQQTYLQSVLPELITLFQRYEWRTEPLERLQPDIEAFTIRVPLVGAFSCGKTSLLNALLGEKLFAVAINPETSLPVELRYASEEHFIGHKPGQAPIRLSREQVRQQEVGALLPDGWLDVGLPHPALQRLEHLTLVDMPGWDSGIEQHARAIDAYLLRSLAYCLVVSVDEGNLHASLHGFLQELALRNMPALLVINKNDKKPAADVTAVQQHVMQELAGLLQQPPLAVVNVSARKADIAPFIDALDQLEQRVGERFHQAVAVPVLQELYALEKRLDTLINQDNLDAEHIIAQRQQLEQDMNQFRERLALENKTLEENTEAATHRIEHLIHSRLTAQLDSLAHLALSGGDVSGSLGQIVRLAVIEGIEQEFAPKLKRYFSRVSEELPASLTAPSGFSLSVPNTTSTEWDLSGLQPVINALMVAITAKLAVLGPVGLAIGTVIGVVVNVLTSLFGGGSSPADEAERRREQVKQQLLNSVIPQVTGQVAVELRPYLHRHLASAQQEISEAAERHNQQHQQTLAQLQAQLQQGQAEFERSRQRYQADQQQLHTIIRTVLEYGA
jgi:GTPase SAR1 family protein/cytochrome c556